MKLLMREVFALYLCFLCREHVWRFIFDYSLAIAAVTVLIQKATYVSFLVYMYVLQQQRIEEGFVCK